MAILTFTFGTITAMLVPILTAVVALRRRSRSSGCSGTSLTVPSVAPTLATMIGLGVGIDYALFIVTRHFRGLEHGLPMRESIARATATSGGAVFFAGCTVTIALVSLAIAQIPLVTTMGLMAAVAVVVAVLAALDAAARVPRGARRRGSTRCGCAIRKPESAAHEGLWARWARAIAHRPLLAGLAALAILIPLTIPLFSLSLGQKDMAALSESTTARQAYDLLDEAFGPGTNGPLLIAVTLGSPAEPAAGGAVSSKPDSRRATRARPIRAWRSSSRTSKNANGVAAVSADPDRQGGHDRVLQRDLGRGPRRGRDDRAREPPARHHDPGGREGHGPAGPHRRQHRRLRGPRRRRSRASSRSRSSSSSR